MDDGEYDVEEKDQLAPTGENSNVLRAATARAVSRATEQKRTVRPRAPPYGPATLLSERGFRWLRGQSEPFLQGLTDDPSQNLDRLMTLYREWAHHLSPQWQFRDFVDKTERHCRTAIMKSYLNALQEPTGGENPPLDEVQFMVDYEARHVLDALHKETRE